MGFWGSYPFFAICLVASVCAAIVGLLLVRKYFGHLLEQSHHTVAGPFLSIIGTLYAVVLGFIVVDSLNTFQAARGIVEREANAIHDIYNLAQGLPEPAANNLRRECYEYSSAMVAFEWTEMETGNSSPKTHKVMDSLWNQVSRFKPQDAAQTEFLSQILDEMQALGDARHSRLLAAQPLYDTPLWVILAVGSTVTIIFTYFFAVEPIAVQILMTALVTVVVTLDLIVIAMFGAPFSGDVKVSPRAFEADLKYFRNDASEHRY